MENKRIERAYDIKGMCFYAFRNLKMLLIVMVIGALLGLGFSIITNKVYISNQVTTEGNQEIINNAKAGLSAQRIQEVESTYSSYVSLTKQKEYLQKFIKNSIYLNLDETSAKSNTVIYSIDGNKNANAIASSYKSLIKNNEMFDSIKKIKGLNVDSAYLSELVDINTDNDNSTQIVIDGSNNRSFTLTIYGKNDEQCKDLTKCVKKEIDISTKRLKKSFGDFEIKNSGDTYEPVVSTDISQSRMEYDNKLSSVNQAITNSIYNLSEDQKTYFNVLVDTNTSTISGSAQGKKINYTGIIKNIFMGIFLLSMIYFIISAIKYIASNIVYTQKEYTKTFDLDVITSINHSSEIDINVAVEELVYLSKKLKNKKIGLLSSIKDNEIEINVYEKLKEFGVECDLVSSTPSTKSDFASLLDVQQIVVFEELGKSTFHDIEKMLRYYELKNINVIGTVLIK